MAPVVLLPGKPTTETLNQLILQAKAIHLVLSGGPLVAGGQGERATQPAATAATRTGAAPVGGGNQRPER